MSIYTKDPNNSKITHISDIESSEISKSILIDHMEDVYIVAESQGQNAVMSLTANLLTSSGRDIGEKMNQGNESNYNTSYKKHISRNTCYPCQSRNNDSDEDESEDMSPAAAIAMLVVI